MIKKRKACFCKRIWIAVLFATYAFCNAQTLAPLRDISLRSNSSKNLDGPQAEFAKNFSLFPIEQYSQEFSTGFNLNNPLVIQRLLLDPKKQKSHYINFQTHYTGTQSPWHPAWVEKILINPQLHLTKTLSPTLEDAIYTMIKPCYIKGTDKLAGVGSNFRPYAITWLDHVKFNMNLPQFKGVKLYKSSARAIATDNLQGRRLPTEEVFFTSNQFGKSYPFDLMQIFTIWAGTPLYIIGESIDRAWVLVHTAYAMAWVKSTGVARVSEAFVKQWTAYAQKNLYAIVKTQVPIIDSEQSLFRFSAHIGMVFPGYDESSLLIPVRDLNGKAQLYHSTFSKHIAQKMPLRPDITHFRSIMDQLIGLPYGRGGLYFYNDCASELKNLFTPFGIWLPLYSANQVNSKHVLGRLVDISHLSPQDRQIYLSEKAHPFMTLLYIRGHIFLYIGTYPIHASSSISYPWTYQNIWSLNSKKFLIKDEVLLPKLTQKQAIIGKSVLLPLLEEYPENPGIVSQLSNSIFKLFYLDEFPPR